MSLKQINLTFNETLIIQLQQAAQQHKSLSAFFNVFW